MPELMLAPPLCGADDLDRSMRETAYAVLSRPTLCQLTGCDPLALEALRASWNDLPPDRYLKDGGRYRRRRHSCFVVDGEHVEQAPHRAHWQPLEYNALHGGMLRWFEPMLEDVVAAPAWAALLLGLGRLWSEVKGAQRWFVEAHQFRIDTTDGIGRPTPEGAHRDGVDFVAVLLVGRRDILGGETRVFEATGNTGLRFTLTEPWSALVLDDARVIHESTPIQPRAAGGCRDTLVLTYRRGGFQGDAAAHDGQPLADTSE
jgi:hypothetical protein